MFIYIEEKLCAPSCCVWCWSPQTAWWWFKHCAHGAVTSNYSTLIAINKGKTQFDPVTLNVYLSRGTRAWPRYYKHLPTCDKEILYQQVLKLEFAEQRNYSAVINEYRSSSTLYEIGAVLLPCGSCRMPDTIWPTLRIVNHLVSFFNDSGLD